MCQVNQAVEDFVGMKVMLHDIQGEEKEVCLDVCIINADVKFIGKDF